MILKSFDFYCDFQITTYKMILILNNIYLGDLILKSSTYDDFVHLCLSLVSIVTKWCGSVLQTQPHLSTDSCPTDLWLSTEWGDYVAWSGVTVNRYLVNHWMPAWSARGCCPDGWWGAWRPCVAPSLDGPLHCTEYWHELYACSTLFVQLCLIF